MLSCALQVIPNNKRYGLPLNETTVANYLKRLGYHTHAVGKWHLGVYRWEHTPTFRGFDSFLGYYGGGEDYYSHNIGHAVHDFRYDAHSQCGAGCSVPLYVNQSNSLFSYPRFIAASNQVGLYLEDNRTSPSTIFPVHSCNQCGRDLCSPSMRSVVTPSYLGSLTKSLVPFNCSMLQELQPLSDGYSTHLYATRAKQIIRAHDPASPLFLYMPFQAVHSPIQAPQRYITPYEGLDPNRRVFGGMLAALDEAVGEVVTSLKDKGMWDNTLTIFSTDNGGPVGSLHNHPTGIGAATGSQNWPLRGGKGSYYQGGVRGTGWVHGKMLHPSLKGTTNFELAHVTDWLPTLVAAAGGERDAWAWDLPLDGVNQWPMLTQGTGSARTEVLINIERDHPTTAPPAPGETGCNGVGQYAVIAGRYKLLLGGGGEPNTWYHDGLPYNGSDPTPQGGCLRACSPYAPDGCPAVPMVQVFDVLADEAERADLAPSNSSLVAELMAVVQRFNQSHYVDALFYNSPPANGCPQDLPGQPLTPCDLNSL